jgi:FlaG/FlaF family flagellin (archaellin)
MNATLLETTMTKLLTLIAATLLAMTGIASGAEAGFNLSKSTVVAQAESGTFDAAAANEETTTDIENSSITYLGCKTFSPWVGMTLDVPCGQN